MPKFNKKKLIHIVRPPYQQNVDIIPVFLPFPLPGCPTNRVVHSLDNYKDDILLKHNPALTVIARL